MMQDPLPGASPSPNASRRSLWLAAGALLVVSVLLAACGVTPAGQQASHQAAATATATATTIPTATVVPTSTATPTVAPIPRSSLPTLTSAAGWHTVLTMSDTTGKNGNDVVNQQFSASKPYVFIYSCRGNGALKVLYKDTIDGADCNGKVYQTKTLQPPAAGALAWVTVSPLGTIIWELLVSTKD